MEHYMPFGSSTSDRKTTSADFARYFGAFIGDGVLVNPSTNLQVISNSNMTVTVKAGMGFINSGYFYYNDGDLTLTIDVADGTLNRKDNIVIRWDINTRSVTAQVVKGTPASSAVAPALVRTNEQHDLKIAEISIPAGATSIPQAYITDTRANSSVCGYSTGVLQQIDATTLFNQFSDAFTTWFDEIKGQLGTDPAGNLQNQIDAIIASKGAANGIASLDADAHVPKEQLNLNFTGHLIVHVASSDSGSVTGTKVRIRNEQLGSNYVQTIDALGNTTFSLLDNHTYYVVLLDYPSSYYGAAATVTITGGETQELTLTLDTTPHIVGIRQNIDTGVLEYTDGAAAFEPMTVTDGVFHAGSWENQWAADVKPCLLKNIVVQYYIKKTGIYLYDYEHQANGTSSDIRTGADGDVMNELPLAYYKTGIETTGEGTFGYFRLAKEPQDDTWCANAYLSNSSVVQDTIYLPAYDGFVLDGKLRSLCGVAPTVNHTIGEFRTYANANGAGYEQANLTKVQYLCNLMILFFKGVDSQVKIGKGVTSAPAAINTGTMNDKPLFWGDQTGTNGMKFMGIENFYGNVRKWLDGVGYLATNNFGYKIHAPFNDDRTGYTDSGVAIPTGNWINRMSRANGYGMLPSATVAAEADSRYKDYFYGLSSSDPIVAWGGYWSTGSYAGAFYWADGTVSYTGTSIGASLFATPQ
jgi:hypothetical protein